MAYRITLQDDTDRLDLEMLQIPIADQYVEGAGDNTTLDGNVYTDYLYLKHQWSQKWARMDAETFTRLKGFYERQFSGRKYPYYTLSDLQNTTDVYTTSEQTYYGAPIAYTNGISITSYEIRGESQQSAAPTPTSPQPIKSITGELNYTIASGSYVQSLPINLGKNLFNKVNPTVYRGYIANNSTNALVASTTALTVYIPCEPNTTYTVQKLVTGSANRFCVFTTNELPATGVVAYNQKGAKAGDNNNTSYSITTDSSARYLCAYIRASATTATEQALLDSIQIEYGATATSYASYIEPIVLRKIGNAQDRIYKSNWRWYVERNVGKVTLNGTESWTFTGGSNGNILQSDTDVLQNLGDRRYGLSDFYKATYYETSITTLIKNGEIGVNQANKITIRNDALTTKTEFTDWLAANKPSYCYQLAAPVTTEITDVALTSALEAAQYTYLGGQDGTITATAPNGLVAPIMADIAYWYYEHEPTPILRNKAVRMTLNSDGVVDCCGTQQNVQITLRETKND